MKRLLGILLLSSACFAQNWSGVLSSSRAINWSAAGLPSTLPDGETTINRWTPPVRTQCGATVAAGTSVATLQALFNACPNGTYLLLGAGTFNINTTLALYGHSVTLRGSGAMQTTLNMSSGAVFWMGAAGGTPVALMTSDSNFAAGSTTIKVGSVAGGTLAPGIALLSQCDTGWTGNPCTGSYVDNNSIYVCGWNGGTLPCQTGTGGGTPSNPRQQEQAIYINSVANNGDGTYTLDISSGLYMPNWSYARTPALTWNDPTYNAVGAGMEDMTILQTGAAPGAYGASLLIQVDHCYACWVKGVRVIGSGDNTAINITRSKNVLVMNNYFFSAISLTSAFPQTMESAQSADVLILNNINASDVPWLGGGGNAGIVFAYNYSRDALSQYNQNEPFDHATYSSFMLYEGNQLSDINDDDIWGTHGLNTIFRNYLSCWDTPYQLSNPRGVNIDNFQRFDNVVGNAIGTPLQCTTYEGTGYGNVFRIGTADALTASTLMRWGNVSVVTQASDTPANSGIRFVSSEVPTSLAAPNVALSNSVPASNTLPASFFATYTAKSAGATGTGLSWRKVCTTWTSFPTTCAAYTYPAMPAAGPDVTGGAYVSGYAGDIPAAVAWKNLPVDTTYQNSYTIASSAWVGGTETLTFSAAVLPDVTHLMGPFSLSGTTIDGEYLMTASTYTTVAFALGSDPGSLATKTMKFPNVRQFDAAVYQVDTAAGSIQTANTIRTANTVVQ